MTEKVLAPLLGGKGHDPFWDAEAQKVSVFLANQFQLAACSSKLFQGTTNFGHLAKKQGWVQKKSQVKASRCEQGEELGPCWAAVSGDLIALLWRTHHRSSPFTLVTTPLTTLVTTPHH